MLFRFKLLCASLALAPGALAAAAPLVSGITAAIQSAIDHDEVAGAVTIVATKDAILDVQARGFSDLARRVPMRSDSIFWIASMTKPITGAAVMMLDDEGKLSVADQVSKYLPEFANLKTPSGNPARITIAQLLTHTSGLGEAPEASALQAHTLAELVTLILAAPMQSEPGVRWRYCQAGINTAARIVEVVSGSRFDEFVHGHILDPLGMKDTTFRRTPEIAARLVTAYAKDKVSGQLRPIAPRADFGLPNQPFFGNAGLYSTGPDYARFCQMLLGEGVFRGRRFLGSRVFKLMTTVQTGDLETGFLQSARVGTRGANYGWGMGTCILREPHPGVAAMLSAGSFGHGGAWGTQAWVDPVKGRAYILMVQRSNFDNGDNSEVRRAFQAAAAQ